MALSRWSVQGHRWLWRPGMAPGLGSLCFWKMAVAVIVGLTLVVTVIEMRLDWRPPAVLDGVWLELQIWPSSVRHSIVAE